MKTREYVLILCKNHKRKITVKFYLWEKLWLLAAGKFFGPQEKGGVGNGTKNQRSDALTFYFKNLADKNYFLKLNRRFGRRDTWKL